MRAHPPEQPLPPLDDPQEVTSLVREAVRVEHALHAMARVGCLGTVQVA